MIILVRHAIAVSRDAWSGPDDRRPLTRRGEQQAEALRVTLKPVDVDQIVSSPSARCRATIAPFAAERELRVKTSRRLREGKGHHALDLALDAVDDVLLCTHGDVLDDVLRGLRHLGWPVPPRPGRAKGSVWLLARDTCTYVAPGA